MNETGIKDLNDKILANLTEPYYCSFMEFSEDFQAFKTVVNQGIDSHLEAIFFTELPSEQPGRRDFEINRESVIVLVRRLTELEYCLDNSEDHDSDTCEYCEKTWNAKNLAECILNVIGIETEGMDIFY